MIAVIYSQLVIVFSKFKIRFSLVDSSKFILQLKISAAVTEGNFQTALSELASVKPQVDAFFDGVMVMAEDAAVKQNRLNLLNRLAEQMNAVADIALLSE